LSDEDSELERLKAKRLAEMQQNISSRKEIEKPTIQNNLEMLLLNVSDIEV
jgi:hypothetical protein